MHDTPEKFLYSALHAVRAPQILDCAVFCKIIFQKDSLRFIGCIIVPRPIAVSFFHVIRILKIASGFCLKQNAECSTYYFWAKLGKPSLSSLECEVHHAFQKKAFYKHFKIVCGSLWHYADSSSIQNWKKNTLCCLRFVCLFLFYICEC